MKEIRRKRALGFAGGFIRISHAMRYAARARAMLMLKASDDEAWLVVFKFEQLVSIKQRAAAAQWPRSITARSALRSPTPRSYRSSDSSTRRRRRVDVQLTQLSPRVRIPRRSAARPR